MSIKHFRVVWFEGKIPVRRVAIIEAYASDEAAIQAANTHPGLVNAAVYPVGGGR